MLHVHFMQQWFSLSDPAMEEAFWDMPVYRQFAQLDAHGRLPDESTLLRFRHRQEKHKLAELILATARDLPPSQRLAAQRGHCGGRPLDCSAQFQKNKGKACDTEMHSSQKGQQWCSGVKAHIEVDAEPGLVHTVRGTSGNVADSVEGSSRRCLHCRTRGWSGTSCWEAWDGCV